MFGIMIAAFVVLIVLAIVIYLLPTHQSKKQPKKKKEPVKPTLMADPLVKPSTSPDKDWKTIAERWEKNNTQLHQEIEKLKGNDRNHAKALQALEDQKKELIDKLQLEKSWREKEQVTIDKFKSHEKDLKEQIFRTEADLEKEHSSRLRIERDLQDVKIKYDSTVEEKRELGVKAASLETTLDVLKRQLSQLQQENSKLKEKREDVQWVAKSEFDELNKRHQQTLKELEQLKARG